MATNEEITDQQILLQTYRNRLTTYLHQLSIVGPAHAQPEIFAGINETRANIRRIKNTLRQWSIPTEDHPNDEDNSSTSSANQMPSLPPSIKIGSHSINIGVGDLKDTQIHVGDKYELGANRRQISLRRSSARLITIGGITLRTFWLILFGLIGMIIGFTLNIINLIHFTAFQNSGSMLISLGLIIVGGPLLITGIILHVQRFIHAWGYNFERDKAGGIFMTTIEGICPRRNAPLRIRNVGSNEKKKMKIVCRRNPMQHSWEFDFTTLPDIEI